MKFLYFLFLLLFITVTTMAQTNIDKRAVIDSLFASFSGSVPGAAVMIIHNGEIQLKKGYGLASLEESRKIDDATNFRLASITKQFTAEAIMNLIEEEKLSLDTKLTEVLPEFPAYANDITIHHLLCHTSGLVDYEDLLPDTLTEQVHDIDVVMILSNVDSLYFQPGEQHRYSNSGYAVLAMIVEKVSGISFETYLKQNIFEPLGMFSTLAYVKNKNTVENRAFGYDITEDGFEFHDQSLTSAVLGDGGIYSNLNDLYKWLLEIKNPTIISPELFTLAITRKATNDGSEFDYGYGWRLVTYRGEKIVYHTGSTQGFRNILYTVPEKDFQLVLLTNRNAGGEFVTKSMAEKIVDIYLFSE